jgi:mono/diheme cytochrome c family protein
MKFVLLLWLMIAVPVCTAAPQDTPIADAAAVSFSRDIAPILLAKCIGCHGPEKTKGGFRVQNYDSLLKSGKSKRPSILPGHPEASELFTRITTDDPDDRMPQKDDPLSPAQIDLFRRWITAGAIAGDHASALALIVPRAPSPAPPALYTCPVPILALAFAPDGKSIAASGHNEVIIWSLDGTLEKRITNTAQRVHTLAFHPTEPVLAVAGGTPGRSGELTLYNYITGKLETNLVRAADELLALSISADGKRLAAGGADNSIHVFDWASRKRISFIQQHADWVTGLDFNSNATRIASSSRDRTARIYDSETGDLETTYAGHENFVFTVAFLSSGRVASGGRDKALDIWDEKEGKRAARISGFEGEIYKIIRGHSGDSGIFAAGADKKVRQYSESNHRLIHSFDGQRDAIYSLALNEGSTLLAAGGYDGVITIWNIKTGDLEHSFIAAPGFEFSKLN